MKRRRFDGRTWVALSVLIILAFLSIGADFLAPDPNAMDFSAQLRTPSAAHWFGTDELGRDYWARTLQGARVTLGVAFLAMLLTTAMGVVVGMVAGYKGGFVDSLLMRGVDVLSAIPWLILVTVIGLYLKPGLGTIIVVIGFFTWMPVARLVRAETLSLREREYVSYARVTGIPSRTIILRHLLPGVMPTVVVSSTLGIANAILTESALSFLGLGVKPPATSWGAQLQNAQAYLGDAPYLAFIPGLLIVITVLAVNRIGASVREAIDPRSRS
jgi:peptide/nickel transport system permease protein